MTGELPEHMHRHAGIRHPGQARVPEIVAPKMLEPRLGHHLIPMGRVLPSVRFFGQSTTENRVGGQGPSEGGRTVKVDDRSAVEGRRSVVADVQTASVAHMTATAAAIEDLC
ncbi:hypothetical protein Ssi03_41840 [Sphaerisporangium siamense]|uniref:Uncharacterized protein n=1 Tax=Sphaerisporangium siamense TaxID=795645 RepID=A0A7W7DDF8_9ACTN|nr:hypothetical protein [Sphaerisporangium siamense]MBB4704581.1 hypothetical protein [Sphaerisporangium siamense]GII86194.1 hypothetical protein Ssi03_41840 [Sphaerisporangium siamense]